MKRYILILTEAELASARLGVRLANEADAGSTRGDRSLGGKVFNADPVDAKKLAHSIGAVLRAACDNSCTCGDADPAVNPGAGKGLGGHDRGCWVTTEHRAIERVEQLIRRLQGFATP